MLIEMIHLSLVIILLIFVSAMLAGTLGSLVGLGGGVLIVPLLTLAFGLPIRYAIGTSIVAVIATSSGAAAAYVRNNMTNMRIGLFLEMATTIGAICGAFLAGLLAPASPFFILWVIPLILVVPQGFKIGQKVAQGVPNH